MLKYMYLSIAMSAFAIGCASPEYIAPSTFQFATTPYPNIDGKNVNSGWMDRFNEMCKTASKAENCKVVFLGDSITDFWSNTGRQVWEANFAPYQPLNFGISGDRVENVLWRVENGLLQPALQPDAFVIMIGTNNIGHRDEAPEAVANGISKLVHYLRDKRPDAKILLLGIFPREKTLDAPRRVSVDTVNRIIKNYADGKHIFYQDLSAELTRPDGSVDPMIMPDYLHLNAAGYAIWARSIMPKLKMLTE